MNSCPNNEALQRWIQSEEPEANGHVIEAHVELCEVCQKELERFVADFSLIDSLRSSRSQVDATDLGDREFFHRVRQAPYRAATNPKKPGESNSSATGVLTAGQTFPPGSDKYQIVRMIGRGGMGVVYEAIQVGLKRRVAIKMMSLGTFAKPRDFERFRIEAEASARLRHPNIVQIYEIAEQDNLPYLVLEYVEGGSLADKLEDGRIPVWQAVELIELLARAVHYAHQQGVIHRDLKPANILLQSSGIPATEKIVSDGNNGFPVQGANALGNLSPKVADFGLAKLANDTSATLPGTIMGTPAYMAPEQASGNGVLTTAVDIHALGAILFELLTGNIPFPGENIHEVMHKVANDAPPSPRQLNLRVAYDLDVICRKSLAKEPVDRYGSALELAEDLRRFRSGQPISARPVSFWIRNWKWAQRNPVVAILVLMVIGSGIAFLAGTVWYEVKLTRLLKTAENLREDAERQRDDARENLYLAQIPLAQRAWESSHVDRMQQLLEVLKPRRSQDRDPRHMEWHYLNRLAHTELRTLSGHEGPVTHVAYRFDGKRIATASVDKTIRIWDAETGQLAMAPLIGHEGRVTSIAFSPDGSKLVSSGADRLVILWDSATGAVLRRFTGHTDWVYHVEFSHDGRRIVSGSTDQTIRIWKTDSTEPPQVLGGPQGHSKPVTCVTFSPNDMTVASASADHTVRLWDLAKGVVTRVFDGHSGYVYQVVFTPDGKSIATSSFDKTIRIWDCETGQQQQRIEGHMGQIRGLAIDKEGRSMASAGYDGTVRTWDIKTGVQLSQLRGHQGRVNAVAFHPQKKWVVSVGDDHSVRIWDPSLSQESRDGPKHDVEPIRGVAFSADGQRLLSVGQREIHVFDVREAKKVRLSSPHRGIVHCVASSSDGKWFATGSADGTIQLWDSGTLKPIFQCVAHDARVAAVQFNATSSRLVSCGDDGLVKIWNANDGSLIRELVSHTGRATGVCFSPDDRWIASSGDDKKVRVWDAATGAEIQTLGENTGWTYCLAFSPDGSMLASGGEDASIKVWNVHNWRLALTLETHQGRVSGVAFSRDNRRLFSSGYLDQAVKIWDLTRGQELLSLRHPGKIHALAVSPNLDCFVTAGEGTTVRIWNCAP